MLPSAAACCANLAFDDRLSGLVRGVVEADLPQSCHARSFTSASRPCLRLWAPLSAANVSGAYLCGLCQDLRRPGALTSAAQAACDHLQWVPCACVPHTSIHKALPVLTGDVTHTGPQLMAGGHLQRQVQDPAQPGGPVRAHRRHPLVAAPRRLDHVRCLSLGSCMLDGWLVIAGILHPSAVMHCMHCTLIYLILPLRKLVNSSAEAAAGT